MKNYWYIIKVYRSCNTDWQKLSMNKWILNLHLHNIITSSEFYNLKDHFDYLDRCNKIIGD